MLCSWEVEVMVILVVAEDTVMVMTIVVEIQVRVARRFFEDLWKGLLDKHDKLAYCHQLVSGSAA